MNRAGRTFVDEVGLVSDAFDVFVSDSRPPSGDGHSLSEELPGLTDELHWLVSTRHGVLFFGEFHEVWILLDFCIIHIVVTHWITDAFSHLK